MRTPGTLLLQHLAHAGDGAAGADRRATNASRRSVGRLEDLERGGAAVDLGIGRVLELLRHEVLGMLAQHLLGGEDGARHALDGRREVDLGAVAREQALALHAHVVGHREDQPVALHRAHHREPDAGVAARRLDDRARPA